VIARNRGARAREAAKAETIVDAEVEVFWRWFTSLDVVPTIVALRERAEAIRRGEVERRLAALGPVDPRQREAIERLTQAIVNKVLHVPVTTLRRHRAGPSEAFYVDAARRLFRLGTDPPGETERESTQAARGGSRAGVGPGRAAEAAREFERSPGSGRAPDGPREEREAERESARAGRRGPGASEEAQRGEAARAPDGPPEELAAE